MLPSPTTDRVLNIYLALTQYPILESRIRFRMREALFSRGIILQDAFESEVREKAIISQVREGLRNPYVEETFEQWELRLDRVRESLTDFYFAYNLPYEDFENIVRLTLAERGETPNLVAFNPELAPQEMLFEQAEMIEHLPREQRRALEARLQEIKVVLIRTLITDQLAYLKIARKWLTMEDLQEIRRRKIGYGKIGGKSAGMILAYRILCETAPIEVRENLRMPDSYYLASDVFYTFLSGNNLVHWSDQKYKAEEQMRAEFPSICDEFARGGFPRDILDMLRAVLDEIGNRPLIVRSSSLLEDSFGTSFAGKYDSFFCPNQGHPEENLRALTRAITQTYASVFNPNSLIYRHLKGLEDYDERIAILLQPVEGTRYGRYWMPDAAGVAFSRNLYRWSPQIRREDGFLRMVWGMGTRAVEAVANDYPRLVALSHPQLHPAAASKAIRSYSQRFVDAIDLEENQLTTLPIQTLINPRNPALRYIAQIDEGDYLSTIRSSAINPAQAVITFDELLRRTQFASSMRTMLHLLEEHYGGPVDTEFTVEIKDAMTLQPRAHITLLQCRPQSAMMESQAHLPENLAPENIIFSTRRMVPRGAVTDIHHVLYVPAEGYFSLKSEQERHKLERTIGDINKLLGNKTFICVGPGRWGTSTPDLGVHVGYGDIYNTAALVEISGKGVGTSPEPSFGTHFFQDLMEAHIYPLAVCLDDPDVIFNPGFFQRTPNRLPELLRTEEFLLRALRLIAVDDFCPGGSLSLVMDDDENRAVCFIRRG